MNVEHPCQKDDEMLPLSKPYDLEVEPDKPVLIWIHVRDGLYSDAVL